MLNLGRLLSATNILSSLLLLLLLLLRLSKSEFFLPRREKDFSLTIFELLCFVRENSQIASQDITT